MKELRKRSESVTIVVRYESRSKTKRVPLSRSRGGMASLELVLGLPFLLLVVASMWSVGTAAMGKQQAAIEARHNVWVLRSDPKATSSQLKTQSYKTDAPMEKWDDPLLGMVAGEFEQPVRVAGWFGSVVKPTSETAIVTGSWDHKQVNIDDRFELAVRIGVSTASVGTAILSGIKGFFGI